MNSGTSSAEATSRIGVPSISCRISTARCFSGSVAMACQDQGPGPGGGDLVVGGRALVGLIDDAHRGLAPAAVAMLVRHPHGHPEQPGAQGRSASQSARRRHITRKTSWARSSASAAVTPRRISDR